MPHAATGVFGPADPAGRRLFWTVLVAGWTAYAALTYLAILPALDPGERIPMIGVKLLRAALGMLATLLLLRLYRRLSFRLPLVILVGAIACGVLGIAWLLLVNLAVAPLRPPGIPIVNWRTLPRQGLDYGVVLVAWSAVLVTVPRWRSPRRAEPTKPSTAPLAYGERLFIRQGEQMGFLPVRMIAAITADGDRTMIHTATGEAWPISRSLSGWEALLPCRQFARIHRGTIVNLEHVTRVEPWSHYTYQVYVAGVKDPLTMSRRYGSALKHRSKS